MEENKWKVEYDGKFVGAYFAANKDELRGQLARRFLMHDLDKFRITFLRREERKG